MHLKGSGIRAAVRAHRCDLRLPNWPNRDADCQTDLARSTMLRQRIHTQPLLRSGLAPSRPHANWGAPGKRILASSIPAGDASRNHQTHDVIMPDYIYCSDQQSLSQAIAAVRTAGSCVMDCEGLELGDAQVRLTLTQIIPITPSPVSYLVDILQLEQQQVPLTPLKQLLSDQSVTKVLYDCRNDAAALWHEQQCDLRVSLGRLLATGRQHQVQHNVQQGPLRHTVGLAVIK